ncbi:hypothetical protein CWR48_16300 [Oceanobacillus arenosus]|uniref:Uncharacterized protein n=1 Tax=Oceanobacillus arenosus TaxID=1229153 RepID=A0A3D8PMX4_9BACI|nr:hypothetical protein [Oceanobacillus arenosus]RDW16599.1 hypothetical protein CWR48_16300 [Oceanobacillus arenosus]
MKEEIGGSKMTKNKLKGLVGLGSLITVIGFILLFFSVNFGLSLAENWIVKQVEQTGGADTSTYLIVIEGSTNNFLAAGSILFGIGLATIIFAYYKILNINEKK